MQKNKMAVWGGLTNSCEKKRRKSKEEKERYTYLNADSKDEQGEISLPQQSLQRNKGKQ